MNLNANLLPSPPFLSSHPTNSSLCASYDAASPSSKSPSLRFEAAEKNALGLATRNLLDPSVRRVRGDLYLSTWPRSPTSTRQPPTIPHGTEILQRDTHTGSAHKEQCAMAGNDGDLLKQATQAMMSRYEGKNTWLRFLHRRVAPALRYTRVVISGLRLFQQDEERGVLHRSPFAPPVPVFSSASGCCCHDVVSRTCFNVKVDEGSYQCGNR